jgi:hypothetical protein
MALKFIITLLLCFLFAALGAMGHPGGLDANGGHTDSKTGIYHYHQGTNAPAGKLSVPVQPTNPVASNSDTVLRLVDVASGAAGSDARKARVGSESVLKPFPWWAYLAAFGSGLLVWRIAVRYYPKRKGIQ